MFSLNMPCSSTFSKRESFSLYLVSCLLEPSQSKSPRGLGGLDHLDPHLYDNTMSKKSNFICNGILLPHMADRLKQEPSLILDTVLTRTKGKSCTEKNASQETP